MTWKTLTRVRQLKAGFTEHHTDRITSASCAVKYYFVSHLIYIKAQCEMVGSVGDGVKSKNGNPFTIYKRK